MDIFKMMKDIGQLKSKFEGVQNSLKEQVFSVEEDGVKIQINGLFELLDIKISDAALKSGQDKLEVTIKKCFEKVNRQAKETMQKEFKKTAGMSLPGLGGLFGS